MRYCYVPVFVMDICFKYLTDSYGLYQRPSSDTEKYRERIGSPLFWWDQWYSFYCSVRFVWPTLPSSLYYPLRTATSVFYNVYIMTPPKMAIT